MKKGSPCEFTREEPRDSCGQFDYAFILALDATSHQKKTSAFSVVSPIPIRGFVRTSTLRRGEVQKPVLHLPFQITAVPRRVAVWPLI